MTNLGPATLSLDTCHQENTLSRTRAQYRFFQAKGNGEQISLQEVVNFVQNKDRKQLQRCKKTNRCEETTTGSDMKQTLSRNNNGVYFVGGDGVGQAAVPGRRWPWAGVSRRKGLKHHRTLGKNLEIEQLQAF